MEARSLNPPLNPKAPSPFEARELMKKNIKYNARAGQSAESPLVSGDRVIAKCTQYLSKTGFGKYETKHDKVREYIVKSISSNFVELEEVGTGTRCYKHEDRASKKLPF